MAERNRSSSARHSDQVGERLFEMNPESTAHAPEVIQLNDSVYQLYRPAGTRSMQVVFFHGFQLEDYEDAHTKTWTSGDGSVWPQTWLVEKFPQAHVLSISYNRWVTTDRDGGKMDLFKICENLRSDLLSANREEPRCPIILVGHSFGGLVIKELCVHVSNRIGCERDSSTKSSLEDFLNDVRGICFYGTPHRGIRKQALAAFTAENQYLFEYVDTLSAPAARTEFDFSPLSEKYKWQIIGLGESHAIKKSEFLDLGLGLEDLEVVTPEASSRYGWRYNTAENTDHITITRPKARTQRTFTALMGLLSEIKAKAVVVERPVHQSQGIPEYHVGLGRSSHDVAEKLANMEKLKNARVLGIVGMGGIGKTTIAKAVFNKISRDFEYTCFVDNVKGIKNHKLEDQVLSHFHHDGMQVERKDVDWSTMKGKKTLIVMDDVNSEDQLKNLLKPWECGVGSRLIITSRDRSILKFYTTYDVYEVDFLRAGEAEELFCQRAFGLQKVPEGNQEMEADVVRVLEKCQGLPLTLEMVGSHLKGHDGEAEFWEETIVKLGNVQDIRGDQRNTVWASLQMSYDTLAPIEREMFLEAATCFFEQPLERALAVWRTEHGSSITGWENLLSKSMVKQVHRTRWKRGFRAYREIEYMEIWVHEHFRDWAKQNSERGMVVGVDEEAHRIIDLLKADEVKAGATKTLRLRDRNEQAKLQLNLLEKVTNLKYLELEGISHEGSTKTFPKLLVLRWHDHQVLVNVKQMKNLHYQVLPLNLKQMNNLAILELSKMKIPEEFPKALGNLVNLRILSLCYLEGLDHLPENIGDLSSLKQLELEGLRISTLPDSFCKLYALRDLSIVNCSSLKTLPESFGKLTRLEYMWIAKCSILKRLPDSFGNIKFLKDLCILSCPILQVLPGNLQSLSCLERLQLDSCSQSSRLPNFGQLKALLFVMINGDFLNLSIPTKQLKLSGETLDKLSPSFEVLSAVEDLEVFDRWVLLKKLPENLGTLSTLKRLNIRCEFLEELPESFGNLSALTDLTLECRRLERLPENFKHLSSLERLVLDGCAMLREFPNVSDLTVFGSLPIDDKVFQDLSAIKKLFTLFGFTLEKLSASFWALSSLEDLEVFDLWELKRLPENFGTLSTLQRLTIRCELLEELPESFGNLSALTDLTLACPSLERLPQSFENLSSLERLVLDTCGMLRELPNVGELTGLVRLTIDGEAFEDLSAIKELTVAGQTLEKLSASFGVLSALEDLEVVDLMELKRLPDNLAKLSTLRRLTIRCRLLEELPENFGNLSGLTHLTLACPSLERLPESFKQLCSLERLVLDSCGMLRELPDVYKLTGLVRLTIDGEVFDLSAIKQRTAVGQTLENLSASFGFRSALEELEVVDRRVLRRLVGDVGSISTIKRLTIRCGLLEELPENFGNLSGLTDLTLVCPSLERLPKSCKHLPSLERLVIDGCAKLKKLPYVKELTLLGKLNVFEDLSAIKKLTVYDQPIRKLSAIFGVLSAVEDLEVVDSWVLKILPYNFGTLSTLKRLTIRCEVLKELPENFGNLSALTDLTLECPSVERLPESFKHLSSLERLVLDGCFMLRELTNVSELTGLVRLTIDGEVVENFSAI